MLYFLIGFACGAVGLFVGMLIQRKMMPVFGVFHIDRRDPMKDICKMELTQDLDDFLNEKRVIFVIDKIE